MKEKRFKTFSNQLLKNQNQNSVSSIFKFIPKIHHNYQKVFLNRRYINNANTNNPQKIYNLKVKHKNIHHNIKVNQYLDQQVSNLLNQKTISQNSIVLFKQPAFKKLSIQVNNKKYMQQQNIGLTQYLKERKTLKTVKNNAKYQRVKTQLQQNHRYIRKKQHSLNSKIESLQLKSKKIMKQLSIQQLVQPLDIEDERSKQKKNTNLFIEIQNKRKLSAQRVNIKGHRRFITQNFHNQKSQNWQAFKSIDFEYIPKSKIKQKFNIIQNLKIEEQLNVLKSLKKQDIKCGIGPWITKGNKYQKQYINFFS